MKKLLPIFILLVLITAGCSKINIGNNYQIPDNVAKKFREGKQEEINTKDNLMLSVSLSFCTNKKESRNFFIYSYGDGWGHETLYFDEEGRQIGRVYGDDMRDTYSGYSPDSENTKCKNLSLDDL